jgi:Right handed beta helix region
MNRRDFVTALLCTAALPLGGLAFRAAAQAAADPVNVVERFGFVPDGRTDNYAAFHRWADHVNAVGGGHYLFPPGTYLVTRHRTKSLQIRDPGTVTNSRIDRVDGLTITGYGARIRLNGAFHRSARPGPSGEALGTHMALFMPFEIHRSSNVTIKGFDMDGGVAEMSRDPQLTEIYAALIAIHGCSGVILEDLDLHHCQTDGVYIASSFLGGKPSIASRDVTLRNVKSHDNARGGLGAMQVYGLLCVDCAFNHNGPEGAKYLAHAPRYGVDIEPDYILPDVDILTGNVEFRRCEFNDNISALLAAYSDRFRGYLRIIDCRSSNRPGGPYHMILNWPGALIQGGVHDAGAGQIHASWQEQKGGDVTIRDCEIRSSGLYGLSHYFDGNLVRFEGVRLVGTHRGPGTHGEVLTVRGDPGGGRRNLVRSCDIFIPAARKSRAQPYDYEVVLAHTVSEGNLFRTDLPAAGGQHFAVNYDQGAVARGDRYRGTAPGPQDSFRPSHNSAHDSRQPYSSG